MNPIEGDPFEGLGLICEDRGGLVTERPECTRSLLHRKAVTLRSRIEVGVTLEHHYTSAPALRSICKRQPADTRPNDRQQWPRILVIYCAARP